MVRDGRHRPRTVVTAAGPVEAAAPRVNVPEAQLAALVRSGARFENGALVERTEGATSA